MPLEERNATILYALLLLQLTAIHHLLLTSSFDGPELLAPLLVVTILFTTIWLLLLLFQLQEVVNAPRCSFIAVDNR